ncbi:SCO family protein [Geobacter sp. SVR]|uniref:SCO family protein n=1 Tax=Geobacter sp. SVR TaxID=2495594 RepID=UPI00143EFE01|nr:SCO family protein [Geobacter sp. SVR]BCS55326.1 cytochrome-c oxidase [Geobacter sp. SVR]GCF87251.1 cytochrome-c oxidase [Geobacter sp. SVR]
MKNCLKFSDIQGVLLRLAKGLSKPALLTALVLSAAPVSAHVEEHQQHSEQAASPQKAAVGLEEHLGAKLPLDIAFRDESGRSVRLGGLISGPTIILPVYYGCTNVCNYLQSGLARVLPDIRRTPGQDYRVISISIDDTETSEQAARAKRMYLTNMKPPLPPQAWRFLTGDAADIRRLTEAAGYHFQRKGRDFIHPVASLVIAGDGTIVRYLYGTSFLAKDVSLALVEAREGRVGTTIRKVVDYCFTYDPANKTYVFNLLRVSATVVILCTGGFLAYLIVTGRKCGGKGTS